MIKLQYKSKLQIIIGVLFVINAIVGVVAFFAADVYFLELPNPMYEICTSTLFPVSNLILGYYLLFANDNKKLLFASTGIHTIFCAIYLIVPMLDLLTREYFGIDDFIGHWGLFGVTYFSEITFILFFMLLVFMSTPRTENKKRISLKLWCYFRIVVIINILCGILRSPVYLYGIYDFPLKLLRVFLTPLLYIILYKPIKFNIQNSSIKKAENFSVAEESDKLSNADKIFKYKELLDEGKITQEEFDAKKKQLLVL